MVKGRGRAKKKIDKSGAWRVGHIREVSGADERLGGCAAARVEWKQSEALNRREK